MRVANDVFEIHEEPQHYVYAPLADKNYGRFIQVGEDVINLLKEVYEGKKPRDENLTRKLKRRNILINSKNNPQLLEEKLEFCPTSTTLLLTTACNLRCVYCYSNAGEVPIKTMELETAKKAVDFISANAYRIGKEYFDLCFHGGGEPFVAWPLMTDIVSYAQSKARDRKKEIKITTVTNGVLNKKQLDWILTNNVHLSLSLDGPKDIQDIQRPKKDGSSSYEDVLETVQYLEENHIDYGIRATITNNSINRLQEIASFFTSIAPSAVGYSLEPLNQCGRCTKTNTSAVNMGIFAEEFIKAKASLSQENKKKIHYSGARPNSLVLNFCGASGKNFFITPDGHVTACLEVSNISDPRSKIFFYGKESENGFNFDETKLKTLSSICVKNMPNCEKCFAKYSCAGDCPSRSNNNGNVFDTSKNIRCTANRRILLDYLKGGLDTK